MLSTVSIGSMIIDPSNTAVQSAGTDIALYHSRATMSENASLETMDGSEIIDCLSESDVSRSHK